LIYLHEIYVVEMYLVQDVFQRVWAVNGEADELFLARSVPKREFDAFSRCLVLDLCDVVLENGGYVALEQVSVYSERHRFTSSISSHSPLGTLPGCS
jgi:hypothetical protein